MAKKEAIARNGRKLKTASATATTAMQENASAALFRLLFKDVEPNDVEGKNTLWSATITTDVAPGNRFASLKDINKAFISKKEQAKKPNWKRSDYLSKDQMKIITSAKTAGDKLRVKRGLKPMKAKGSFSDGITTYPPNTKDPRAVIFNEFPEEYMKDDDWMETFQLQAATMLVEKVGTTGLMKSPHFTEFDRDAKKGFMEFIEEEIKKYSISKKDTWNPADIWLLKKTKPNGEGLVRTLISSLTAKGQEANIDKLNNTMKDLMNNHELIGVSLKKISGSTASWKVYNLAANIKFYGKPGKTQPPVYEASYENSVDMPLDIKSFEGAVDDKEPWKRRLYNLGQDHQKSFGGIAKDVFSKSEAKSMGGKPQAWGRMDMTVIVKENGTPWAKLEIKSNSTSSASGQNLKFEPVQLSAKAARMGKAEGVAVGKKFKALGIQEGPYFNNWQAYPRSLNQWEKEKVTYKTLVEGLKKWKCWKQRNSITGDQFVQNVTYLFKEVQLLMKYDIEFDDILRKGKKSLKPDYDTIMDRVKKAIRKKTLGQHAKQLPKGKRPNLEIYAGETFEKKVKGQLVEKEQKEFIEFKGTGYKYGLVTKVTPVGTPTEDVVLAEIYETPNWGSDYTNAKFISNRLRFNITSKLMIVKVADMLMRLEGKDSIYQKTLVNDNHTKFDVFCTEVIMLAQKAGPQFGPFAKLY